LPCAGDVELVEGGQPEDGGRAGVGVWPCGGSVVVEGDVEPNASGEGDHGLMVALSMGGGRMFWSDESVVG